MIEQLTITILAISVIMMLANSYLIWRVSPKQSKYRRSIVLDTSALIDGRILEVVRSGFVPSNIVIPRFVLAELQLLADKADHMKRERARYGLSVVKELQDSNLTSVIIATNDTSPEGVDEKLIDLSLKHAALLYTTDFNLLKVAEIQGVRILNINELAQNLRPVRLPGEKMELKIVQKGQERDQGVGYLEDGTMVVVEAAKNSVGKTLQVEFTRSLQTAAGRMMFAEKVTRSSSPKPHSTRSIRTNKPSSSRKQSSSPRPRRKSSVEDRLIETINSQ